MLFRSANSGDLAPAPGHEDLTWSDDLDISIGRRSLAIGMVQPEPERPPRRNLEGEGGRKVNPRSMRHGGMEHKLSGGALGVDSRRDNMHRRDSPAPTAASTMALDTSSCRAPMVGVQRQREPWRRSLAPRPRHLLPHALISAAEDQPLLRRKRVRTLSGGLSLLSCGEPMDGRHQRETERWRRGRRGGIAEED